MSAAMLPPHRPKQAEAKTAQILLDHGVRNAVALLGCRGYYLDTMGARARNDRGVYDDALFLASPQCYAAFNGNTDPSIARPGVAVLEPGLWSYRVGVHGLSRPASQRYTALVQASPVTVLRDGGNRCTGMYGINIHRGSRNSTSSLGCQTIHPDQWGAFMALVLAQMRSHGQKTLPYLLVDVTPEGGK